MDTRSFTAGANYRIYAATMIVFYARAFGIADTGDGTQRWGYSASAALQRLGGRVIGPATAKYEVFVITVNGDTIGVVPVDLERGVPMWNVSSWDRSVHRLLRYDIVTRRGSRREQQIN
jgi:hypothetical protein